MAKQMEVVPRDDRLDGKPSRPPSLATFNWRELFDSSWKDTHYRRRAIASLTQAVYLLELDRQENRTKENALAPSCWIPFKYKPTQILIDERDGSIFGAIFEWDRFASLSDFKPFKPIGAPRAVLALRGTLIRFPTMWRDFEDDFRFIAWESLKGSVRFEAALDAVKSVSDTYGSSNVCIAGHSLGAGYGLQVGKELAKERINVETHLFHPPSVSLAMTLGNNGEKAEYVWNKAKFMLPSGSEAQVSNDGDKTYSIQLKRLMPRLSRLMDAGFRKDKWVPHLYVNNNDWISFFYIHTDDTGEKITDMENMDPTNDQSAAKLFVVSKENQKFLEAHGLKQWWSSDAELEQDIRESKLTSMQLRSLNTGTPSKVMLFYYPRYVSLATSLINIREITDFVWNRLRSVPYSSGKAQVNNDGDNTSGVGLKGWWIPQLSGFKDAACWVCKWVPHLYANKNTGPVNGKNTAKLFVVSKEQQKFLAAHGLEQWWPSGAELQQAIHDSKLISRQIRSLCTGTPGEVTKRLSPSFTSLAMCRSNIGEKEEFVWKWNSLKSMLPSIIKAQVKNDGDKTSGVGLKGWIPQLSGLKDAAYSVGKRVPRLYVNKNDGTGENMADKENMGPANGKITEKLFVISKEQQEFLAAHGLEQWWPSDAELQQAIHDDSKLISRQIRSLCTNTTTWEVTKRLNPSFISLAMCASNIGEKEEFAWKWNSLKSMLPSIIEAQVSNDGDKTPGISLKGWIPQISGFKDAAYWVGKWVPHMYSNNSDYINRQLRSLPSINPSQVSHLFNLCSVLPAMSLGNTGEKATFVWKRLKSMCPSSSEAQVSNDADKTSGVGLKSWIPTLSGLKDAGFGVGNLVPYLHVNKSGAIEEKMVDKENEGPSQ